MHQRPEHSVESTTIQSSSKGFTYRSNLKMNPIVKYELPYENITATVLDWPIHTELKFLKRTQKEVDLIFD